MSIESMHWIFCLRSRDLAIRGNFPKFHKDLKCVVNGCPEIETQRHIFYCMFLSSSKEVIPKDISYDDLFSDELQKQQQVMSIMRERVKRRNKYMKDNCNVSPRDPGINLVIRKARKTKRRKNITQH